MFENLFGGRKNEDKSRAEMIAAEREWRNEGKADVQFNEKGEVIMEPPKESH